MEAFLLGIAVASVIGLVIVLRRRKAPSPQAPSSQELAHKFDDAKPRRSTSTMIMTLDDVLAEDEGAE